MHVFYHDRQDPDKDPSRLGDPSNKIELNAISDFPNDDDNDQPKSAVSCQLPLRAVPKPTVNRDVKAWDITEKFTQASSALDIGQLVKDEYFTLFESIGALEIMDPKMDSGFLQPGETLEDDYDALKPLLPEEVIGIMDQLLCYEMAWHQGYPLSQTLFTSVYIDKLLWPDPRSLEEAQFYRGDIKVATEAMHDILRAYCLATIKCCDFVITKITSRDYFEEEDFCTHTYNRQLFTQVPLDFILHELELAMKFIKTEQASCISAELKSALVVRLEFRKALLIALSPDYSMSYLDKYWPPVSGTLPVIETTHNLGRPVPGSFSTKLQRRLASTVPPRPVVELEFKDALERLVQLCVDCEEAVRYTYLEPSPQEYQSFMWAFASRKPQPLAYARSYLSNFIFSGNNEVFEHLLREDLRGLVFPEDQVLDPVNWTIDAPRNPMMPKDKRLEMASLIDEFTNRAIQNYHELWTALCQNRCRMRRMLCHSILAFDQLQSDAGVLDDDLHALASDIQQYPLITWVYHHKLRQIEWVVQLGFEQEIYLPDELPSMYYWLSRIAETRKRLLMTLLEFFEQRQTKMEKGKKADIEKAERVKEGKEYIESLLAEASGTKELAEALSSFYAHLAYLNLLPTPPRPLSNPSLRYELRMKPFLTLTPSEVIPFAELTAQLHPYGPYDKPNRKPSLSTILSDPVIWQYMDQAVKSAKEEFARLKKLGAKAARAEGVKGSWEEGVQGYLLSCVATGVAIATVKDICKGFSKEGGGGVEGVKNKLRVEIVEAGGDKVGKRYHEWWVVPKVVKL